MTDVTAPAQGQLEAYNNRDIDAFMACNAQDVKVEDGMGNLLMDSWEQMYESYKEMFAASPELHCKIVHRTVVGNYVLDEENVTGRRGNSGVSHVVAVYLIEDGLIKHVRFLR